MGITFLHDLAARVALAAEHLEHALYSVAGEPIPWWPDGRALIERIVTRHAEQERLANPATVFLDALHQAMAAGELFYVEDADWRGQASIRLRVSPKDLRPCQVRIYRIHGQADDDETLAIHPRPTLMALRLDLPESSIRTSLETQGLMRPGSPTSNSRTQLRLQSPLHQDAGRLTAWLIKESA